MGGSEKPPTEAVERNDAAVPPVLTYVRQLTPSARSYLLAELERLQMSGDDIPGSEVLLEQLRAEFRGGGKSYERIKGPARYFFQSVEPFLVNCAAERARAGQISRGSLSAIWELIAQLLPAMTQDYEQQVEPAIAEQKSRQIEEKVAQFQSKVIKSLEIKLATPDGIERLRQELAKYTSSRAAYDDLIKLVVVVQAQEGLMKFQAALPNQIGRLDGDDLLRVGRLLGTFKKTYIEAVPFAVTLVITRLKRPWQIIRLAISLAGSRKIADIVATPYAIIPTMALDHLEEKRAALCQAMKDDRLVIAQDILTDIQRFEYALRAHVILCEASDWGQRLDDILRAVAADVHAEARRIPDNLEHVLVLALRRNDTLSRRFFFALFRARDAFRDGRALEAARHFIRALYASWFTSTLAPPA